MAQRSRMCPALAEDVTWIWFPTPRSDRSQLPATPVPGESSALFSIPWALHPRATLPPNTNIKNRNKDDDDNLKNNNKQNIKINITINSGEDSQFWGGGGFPVFSLQKVLVFSFHISFLPAALWRRRGRGGRKEGKEETRTRTTRRKKSKKKIKKKGKRRQKKKKWYKFFSPT